MTQIYENEYLKTTHIENKEKYYNMIDSIKSSLTSRLIHLKIEDKNFINNILNESAIMLSHSIKFFELGYFDASYYSLRTSLELATQILFFTEFKDYKNGIDIEKYSKFHTGRNNMLKKLKNDKDNKSYKQINQELHPFFKKMEELSQKLNQVVHKNGIENYYTYRKSSNESFYKKKEEEFNQDLTETIKTVAILRLFIDPIPILCEDVEICNKCISIGESGYCNSLLEIIDNETKNKFKNTEIYKSMYNALKDL